MLLHLVLLTLFVAVTSAEPVAHPGKISFLLHHDKPKNDQVSPSRPSAPAIDTSTWSGAAYTPSPAGNQLWWAEYDKYVPVLINEIPSAAYQYGFTTFRVFLHNMVYDADPAGFLSHIDRFLTIADMNSIDPG